MISAAKSIKYKIHLWTTEITQLEVVRRNAGKWPTVFSSMRVKVNSSKKF